MSGPPDAASALMRESVNMNLKSFSCPTSHASSSWANDAALSNIPYIVTMDDVSHASGWLNAVASRNIANTLVTDEVSHARGWLNVIAFTNIALISLTDDVSHASGVNSLNEVAMMNNPS